MHVKKLVVVGVGLIGGSCALALRKAAAVGRIVGVGRQRANLAAALQRGIIDAAYALDDDWISELATADVVLVAAPVAQYPALFASIARAIGPHTIVTDAGSTKQAVVAAARSAFGNALARFVAAHPIAGSEHSGALAADAALFAKRRVIVTPIAETATNALAQISALWETCGATVTVMTPADHDRVLAAVSHLPHLLAFVLVSELAERSDHAELFDRAGSGFRDFTRIAASSAEMWRDIALANREALLAEVDRYLRALTDTRQLLAAGDGAALAEVFARASNARRQLAADSADDAE